jgi:hypothetical protein
MLKETENYPSARAVTFYDSGTIKASMRFKTNLIAAGYVYVVRTRLCYYRVQFYVMFYNM